MSDKLIKIGGIVFILGVGGWLAATKGRQFFSKPIVEPRDPTLSPGVDRRADHDRAGNPISQPARTTEAMQQPQSEPVRMKIPETISDAFNAHKSEISDSTGTLSKGSSILILWSKKFLRWADLNSLPLTNYSFAMKDIDDSRGKRICFSGIINQIEGAKLGNDKVYEGGMINAEGQIIRFAAIGSTGSLVANSEAKFCGIVTEKLSYQSFQQHTIRSIFMIGMFDLPENK